jgi:AraC-like DNA-binding protein
MAVRSYKLAPTRALSPFVAHLRVTELEGCLPVPYSRLPDGQLELTMRVDPGAPALRVVGTRTRALVKPSDAAAMFVIVRFKAGGAYPFFGPPLHELTDQLVDLDDLWGDTARLLAERLTKLRPHAAHIEAVQTALLDRLAARVYEPASAANVRRGLRRVAAAPLLPSVDALARELGASARQLRRGFAEVVGIGPKQYLRVVRFQRALSALRRLPDTNLATIARMVGYSDQSHLNAEFRALAATTPSALRLARA